MAKNNWNLMDPIDVWNCIRDGSIKVFPNGYLDKDICKYLIRNLFLNELKLSREEILNIDSRFLSRYQLGGTRKFIPKGTFAIIDFCFPELEIKEWELKNVPNGFWTVEENRTRFIKWVFEKENLSLSKISDIRKISTNLICYKYGCSKALKNAGSLYNLLKPAVDKNLDFHEWDTIKVGAWSKEKVIIAVRWLIEEKLKWSYEEVYNNISASIFYKNNLGGMLSKFCNNSPLVALKIAYPGKYTSLKNKKPQFSCIKNKT